LRLRQECVIERNRGSHHCLLQITHQMMQL
jgi:hypothetical protein